jgi:protein involved in polysaccharide export with SLBB domain
MFKITRRFVNVSLAVSLAYTPIVVPAQEMTDKVDKQADRTDMFGQTVTPPGQASSVQEAPRRVNINNANAADTNKVIGASTPPDSDFDPDSDTAPDADSGARPGARSGQASAYPDARAGTGGRFKREVRSAERVTNEFQKFISDSTGKILPIFGKDIFANSAAIYSPISGAPVPADYPLGVGDELLIRGWGTIDIDYRARIDRNGAISIPTIGSIVLAGTNAGDAEGVIRAAVAKLYKGVTINVSFGKLRAITVYVVGQASRPGTYTVSSLSTLVTTLFASGGPNQNGSMRRVQVIRGGKVAAELDLYAFIAKGDKSADIKLQDGDSVYIPAAAGYVALVGKVNTAAVYELRSADDTVESMLAFAGGLPVVADPRRAYLERIDPTKSQPRSVEQFALDKDGLSRKLKNGDLLNVTSITPDFSNAVILRGNVDQPIRAPFTNNMRVSDLIPSREYLITRSSIRRQNNAVTTGMNDKATTTEGTTDIASRIGGLIDEINWDYAVVERINRSDLTVSLIPFNLGKVFSDPSSGDNVALQPGDTVTVFSQEDVVVPMDKRRVFVRVEGEVNVPGVYQMTAGASLQEVLARAGGPTTNAYFFGTAFYREKVRREQEINLDKAATRMESTLRAGQSTSAANARTNSPAEAQVLEMRRVAEIQSGLAAIARLRQMKPTGRIAFNLDPKEKSFAHLPRLKLENGDHLVVPAIPEFVHVFGSVNTESSPLWRRGSRVADYLKTAGLTMDADTDNVFVLRSDGSVVARGSEKWSFGGMGGLEVMPGDSIVVPEKFDKETGWSKLTRRAQEWAQIFANLGLGAAAIRTLNN